MKVLGAKMLGLPCVLLLSVLGTSHVTAACDGTHA